MPVSDDIGVLNTQIEQLISSSRTLFAQYQLASKAQDSATTQGIQTQTVLLEKEGKLRELDRLTSTYEQEFLDRKKNPKPKSFFGKLGLLSVQDWVLAVFYFSFILFFVMLFVLAMIHSTARLRVGVILFVLFLIVGYGATAAILLLG